MKKYMIIAMAATLFAGCADSDETCPPLPPDGDRVEIKGNAGVGGLQTRAPINDASSVAASFVASATTGDYTTNAWVATATFTASGTTPAAFSFTPAQYYPVNGDAIYIKGYHPAGTISGKTVTYTTFDGTQDVMLSNQVSGTKATATPLAFTFNHLLSQLQFNLVAGAGYDATKTVTSIVLRSQGTAKTLDVNTGTIATTNTGDITLTGPFAISTGGGTVASTYPMVVSGATKVTVSVTTSDSFTYPDTDITVTTVAGKAHKLTLTFTPKAITATATVTPWDTSGAAGSTPIS